MSVSAIPSFERATAPLKQRNPRHPAESTLYSLVYHHYEELLWCWDERFQAQYGYVRKEVRAAFESYLNCGIVIHGCALAECEACSHSELIAFSCKRRGLCASCDAKRSVLFAEHLHQNVLLGYPTSHVVFTIPKRLRVYFKYNRKLTRHLYTAAWDTWCELVDDALPDMSPGMIMSLHTAGDLLNFHPHVHGLALHGALDKSGVFHSLEAIDTDWLSVVFARHLFAALKQEELITDDTIKEMSAWQHSGFNVWIGEPVPPEDADSLQFLARYLKKCPFSSKRIKILENNSKIRYCKFTENGIRHRDFDPLTFLAELSQHIPNKWEQTVRYFGVYSARTRGALKKKSIPLPLAVTLEKRDEEKPKPSSKWAACIKQVFELNPLLCPKCGGDMKIKSFVLKHSEINRLAKHHKIPAWRAPPKLVNTNVIH